MDRSSIPSLRHGRFASLVLLPLAAAVLVAMSPSPAPGGSGPGPAQAEPPASQLPIPRGPLFPTPSVDPLSAPSGRGVAVSPPADVVGAWYAGSVSSIGYVDPNTGSYSDGGSEGLGYTFEPDGAWQSGFLMTSALYGCQMRVLVFNQGIITAVDASAQLLELRADRSQMHSEDTCSEAGNYDRELVPANETLLWLRTTDEYGEVLMLRSPDSGFSAFRPMQ